MTEQPADTALRAGTRFATELLAWGTGAWAAGRTSVLLGALTLVVLVGAPALFNVPGDKNVTGVAVPGAVRVAIEVGLYGVAATAPWLVLGRPVSAVLTLLVCVAAGIQVTRWRWLASR